MKVNPTKARSKDPKYASRTSFKKGVDKDKDKGKGKEKE